MRAAQLAWTLKAALDDLGRQPLDVAQRRGAGAGQADVGRVDADAVEQVQDAELLLDGRRAHRRRLQSVAQRFVEQQDLGRPRPRSVAIPVEDQSIIHDMSTCSGPVAPPIIEAVTAGALNLRSPTRDCPVRKYQAGPAAQG